MKDDVLKFQPNVHELGISKNQEIPTYLHLVSGKFYEFDARRKTMMDMQCAMSFTNGPI